MSKRSNFDKVPKEFYPTTDPKAVPTKLVEFIRGKTYAEPCYGNGDLEDLLMDVATCEWRSDIRETVQAREGVALPRSGSSKVMDALCLSKEDIARCQLIVTNPPFSKDVLLPLLDHFISLKPTWLLLPADYMHNQYFSDYMKKCSRVISVGRLKWFKDSKHTSTDNFAWYFWPKGSTGEMETVFYGR